MSYIARVRVRVIWLRIEKLNRPLERAQRVRALVHDNLLPSRYSRVRARARVAARIIVRMRACVAVMEHL